VSPNREGLGPPPRAAKAAGSSPRGDTAKVAVQVDGRTLTLTNLGKVLYPETGFTKAEVLDYYQRVAPVLLPHIAGRPLTLKRYPEGVDGEAFFQKHVTEHRPDWIRTARIPSESSRGRGGPVTYLVVDDLPALIWAANLAGLELHVPQWRMPGIRRPDLLVFDLDPGAPANIVDCCRVAEDLRPLLEAEGLAPLAKTSGGKGLQLYAAVSGVTSEQASDRARAFAERLERDQPRRVTSRMTKALRTGKVLIDWSQNNGSKTTIAPYSLRAGRAPRCRRRSPGRRWRPAGTRRSCSSPPGRSWTGCGGTATCSRRCCRREQVGRRRGCRHPHVRAAGRRVRVHRAGRARVQPAQPDPGAAADPGRAGQHRPDRPDDRGLERLHQPERGLPDPAAAGAGAV